MSEEDVDRYTVPGLERGLRILCEFSRHEPSLTAPELARRLGVPRSTVFRLLVTLEQMGFVERTDDGRAYTLGLAVLRLGFEYLGSLTITDLGRPIVDRLRNETGFSANLVVRDKRDIVYIMRAASASPFASSVSIGTRLPAHATVLGHVLLGDLSLSELKALYPESRLEGLSPNTPRSTEELFEAAQRARGVGYVMAEGFFESHISTVAAPVFGESGHIVAALGLTIPGATVPQDRRNALIASVLGASTQLSTLMNFDHKSRRADARDIDALGASAA